MKNWFFGKTEEKANPVGGALFVKNNYVFNRDVKMDALIKEGYVENVIVYKAVRKIADSCADITIKIMDGDREIENHQLASLLTQPNPMSGRSQFIKNVFTDYLITGEMYITKPVGEARPSELWSLNPKDMDVKAGQTGLPSAYVHEVNNKKTDFPVDSLTGKSDVFMMKMYNPLNYWRGMSPLQAAALAADTHNSGMNWNWSLLQNGARPSGVVEFEGNPDDTVMNRLREHFKKTMQGSSNAGEIPVLTGGAKWTEMGKSPKDMDFLKTLKEMTKYIAGVYGVPLPLVDDEASTFNNMETAKELLWTDTVIPLFDEFLGAFSVWLNLHFDGNIKLVADLDSIPALEGVRERRFARMIKAKEAGIITVNEAREAIGYEENPEANASVLMTSANAIPLGLTGFEEPQSAKEEAAKMGYSEQEIKDIFHD